MTSWLDNTEVAKVTRGWSRWNSASTSSSKAHDVAGKRHVDAAGHFVGLVMDESVQPDTESNKATHSA